MLAGSRTRYGLLCLSCLASRVASVSASVCRRLLLASVAPSCAAPHRAVSIAVPVVAVSRGLASRRSSSPGPHARRVFRVAAPQGCCVSLAPSYPRGLAVPRALRPLPSHPVGSTRCTFYAVPVPCLTPRSGLAAVPADGPPLASPCGFVRLSPRPSSCDLHRSRPRAGIPRPGSLLGPFAVTWPQPFLSPAPTRGPDTIDSVISAMLPASLHSVYNASLNR